MYDNSPAQERSSYSYEDQTRQLLALASRLEDVVRPFSESNENIMKTASAVAPMRPTQLGRDLDEAINRFESIIKRIQP